MKTLISIILALLALSGCVPRDEPAETSAPVRISHEDALKMIGRGGVIIVDVRSSAEFADGHIENAVSLPLDQIRDYAESVIPDKDQTILVYCRSGNRSRTASYELIALGYTNVYDFGGINGWPGTIVMPVIP
ncbi:MAG: rhodanese-like domain-containing protein [Oscillospiraceae bacterium]|nr:rhodanese-like domain-containing protein [Oscillospiraceae bacterium]